MNLKFGTSGIRGLASAFTDKQIYLIITAFIKHSRENNLFKKKIFLGRDLRDSSPRILSATIRSLTHEAPELQIIDCGIISTPNLAYISRGELCIVITGSHIPADRNGLKFYIPSGETLKANDEDIFNKYVSLFAEKYHDHLFDSNESFIGVFDGKTQDGNFNAINLYIKRYTSFFGNGALSNLKVIFYAHSSAARETIPLILEKLGAQVIIKGEETSFVPIDTEALDSIQKFKIWIEEEQAVAVVSTDGDGDRPLFIDSEGVLVPGDQLGLVTSEELNIRNIVMPISCNTAILQQAFDSVTLTKIGSPYVVEAMANLASRGKNVAGFEANGGFLLGDQVIRNDLRLEKLSTRDAALPIICALLVQKIKAQTLSKYLDNKLGRFTDSILVKNCPLEISKKIITTCERDPMHFLKTLGVSFEKIESISNLDGIRITIDTGSVIHFRPSGNAPEFRVYLEDDKRSKVETLLLKVEKQLNSIVEQYRADI